MYVQYIIFKFVHSFALWFSLNCLTSTFVIFEKLSKTLLKKTFFLSESLRTILLLFIFCQSSCGKWNQSKIITSKTVKKWFPINNASFNSRNGLEPNNMICTYEIPKIYFRLNKIQVTSVKIWKIIFFAKHRRWFCGHFGLRQSQSFI